MILFRQLFLTLGVLCSANAFTTSISSRHLSLSSPQISRLVLNADASTTEAAGDASPNAAPVLNGKRVLPYKVLIAGLKGHTVAGVYALLNSEYRRG